jgi:hypothetical protein
MRAWRWVLVLLALSLAAWVHAEKADEPRETDWLELMPAEEVEAMMNAATEIDHGLSMRAQQTGTFNTIKEFDGREIKIAGYIVPIETTEDGKMREYFLVPYFGACIHVPPPPPNQIIYVRMDEPVAMTDIWEAYWVTGTLKIERFESDIAATAYTMRGRSVRPYTG